MTARAAALRAAALLACSLAAAASSSAAVAEEDGLSLLQTSRYQFDRSTRPTLFDAGRGLLGQLLNEEPVLHSMAQAPTDPIAQASGCRSLSMIILTKRATPAVIEPIVAAIQGHVAQRGVVTSCISALKALMPSGSAKSLIRNQTQVAEALAAVLRFYADDWSMQSDMISLPPMLGDCAIRKPYVRAGCVDLTWDALERFKDRSDVRSAAWQAFTQYAFCPISGDAIAEYTGDNEGVRRLVQSLRDAVAQHTRMSGFFSLESTILTVGDAVMQGSTDFNGRFDAFDNAGYGQAALSSMRDEQDRQTNDRACFALHLLTEHESTHAKLLKAGALETIVATMRRFKDEAVGPLANAFPVLPSCDGALRNLAESSRETQDALLQLGALDLYASMRQDLLPSNPKMLQLPEVLRARQARHQQKVKA